MTERPAQPAFTQLLQRSRGGEEAALEELMPAVYEELRSLARRKLGQERDAITLQPTALVNEVYLRLVDQELAGVEDRAHFLQLCARVMRNILVDRARARNSTKRDGGGRVNFDVAMEVHALGATHAVDVLVFDELLGRLGELDERKAKVVELRFFGGLSVEDTAAVLDVSERTVAREWNVARAWLGRELDAL